MLDTRSLLGKKGYEFYHYVEEPITPEYSEITFDSIISFPPKIKGHLRLLKGKRLYRHQYEAYVSLKEGKNVILRAGTGSGKTEAWILYAVNEKRRALAMYPTLALANDQVSRLRDYGKNLGFKVFLIDSGERTRLSKEGYRLSDIRREMRGSSVVVTNPAFLLMDIKRAASQPSRSVFLEFIRNMDLVVIDELDFYGPRELSLLFAIIKILSMLSEKRIQAAVLTATLANPAELCEILRDVTGRECSIIDGKPFKRENRVIVVLGKNLRSLFGEAREYKGFLEKNGAGRDVIEALSSYDEFKKHVYKVVDSLRALGIELPSPHIDASEILKEYLKDEGVTVVFTRSIAKAEELYRKLRFSVSDKEKDLLASHHHLISKEKRQEIELKAKRGEVRLIFSPRTLSQGIDIGTIVRIVHVGLPDAVREFHQREGRKGRREEIQFTESIIIPATRWDRELLARGVETFKEWLNYPLEITPVNKDNNYGKMFLALFKVKGGIRLHADERALLEKLGFISGRTLTKRGEKAWYNINFYEFAPPFGIKRVFRSESGEKYLEDISFSDLVEKFQVGCIDYSSDGVVAEVELGGKSGRTVRKVVVSSLKESTLYSNDSLSYALEEYRKIKTRWGERPNIFLDYIRGRIRSESICNVVPPTSGFGVYVKIPYKVVWIVEGEGGRLIDTAAGTIILKNRRVVEVPSVVAGRYNDYSYGRTFELDPGEKLEHLRLGLATLMVFLREKYRLPLGIISYSLSSVGGRKILVLWEEESAGLIEKLEWEKVYRELDSYVPSNIAEIFLLLQDEEAHVEWLSLGGRWDLAKDFAKKVVSYILLTDKIRLLVKDKEVYIPKPGRHLKKLSLDTIILPLTEDKEVVIGYVGFYDGDAFYGQRFVKEYGRVSGDQESFQRELMELINQGFDIIVYDIERLREDLHSLGLTFHAALISGLIQMKKVHDTKNSFAKLLGEKNITLEELFEALNIRTRHTLAELSSELMRSRARVRNQPLFRWYYFTKFLEKKAKEYLEDAVKNIYILFYVAKSLEGKGR